MLLTQIFVFGEIHAFLRLNWIGHFGIKWAFLHHENYGLQEVFFQKLTHLGQGSNVLDAPASNLDGCLWRDTFVSSMQLNKLIWRKQSLSPPATVKIQEVFLSKTNWIPKGNNMLDSHASNRDGFLLRDTCYSSTYLNYVYVEQTELMFTLKILSCRNYSFQNINRFSQGNNMLGAAVSSIDGLFGEIHVFLQLGWRGLFAGKQPYLHLEHPSFRKYSFQN
jgi:hypothetical protein